MSRQELYNDVRLLLNYPDTRTKKRKRRVKKAYDVPVKHTDKKKKPTAPEPPPINFGRFGGPLDVPQDNTNWNKLYREAYQPQFDYLDTEAQRAKNRARRSKQGLKQLYGSLTRDIASERPDIRKQYRGTRHDIRDIYQQGVQDIGNTYDTSRDKQLAILKKLGIQQAAPNVTQGNMEDKTFLQSVLNVNSAAERSAQRELQAASVALNREQANAARAAGADARSQVGLQLGDILGQIGQQRAGIMSQVNTGALNAKQQAQQNAYDQAMQERQFQYGMAQDAASLGMQQQGLDWQKQKYFLDQQAKQAQAIQAQDAADPGGKVNQLALQLYPNAMAARNAVEAVQSTWMNNMNQISSPIQLANATIERLKRANGVVNDGDNIIRLAIMMYNQLNGKGTTPQYTFGGY